MQSLPILILILTTIVSVVHGGTPPSAAPHPVSASPPAPVPALSAPMVPVLKEEVGDALPTWRRFTPLRPALVLLSHSAFLEAIPAKIAERAKAAALNYPADQLAKAGDPGNPNPLFLPEMTVRLALSTGSFREMVWVLPSAEPLEALQLDVFRRQMVKAGFLTQGEAGQLRAAKGGFAGTAAGVPFRAIHPQLLPTLEGSAVLHIDVSYFQALYRNEVKTPVFEEVRTILTAVRQARWPLVGVTISQGNQSARVSRDLRFLGGVLKEIFSRPTLLDQNLPDLWRERANALYLATFLENDKVITKLQNLASRYPKEATVHFDLYRALRARKAGDRALAALKKAAALDRGYAPEYIELAQVAYDKGFSTDALEMLGRAERLMPADPFVLLFRSDILLGAGRPAEALPLLKKLEKVPWSSAYYPHIPRKLAEMRKRAEKSVRHPGKKSRTSGENK